MQPFCNNYDSSKMMTRSTIALHFVMILLADPLLSLPLTKMIDMSYSFSNEMPTLSPTIRKFEILNPEKIRYSENVNFKIQEFVMAEHSGTHMDAPDHFNKAGGWTIDRIPVERFEAPAIVVNISAKASTVPDALVSLEDLREWEEQHGRIPPKSVVLMYSGWGRFWPNKTAFYGSDDITKVHFPGFSGAACEWLMSERHVAGVGSDTPSCDNAIDNAFPCHAAVLNNDGFVLEIVANVGLLPPRGATLRAFPMKIKGGTGAPTRIIATLPTESTFFNKLIGFFNML